MMRSIGTGRGGREKSSRTSCSPSTTKLELLESFDDGPVGVLQSDAQTILNIVIVVPRPMFSFTEWIGLGHRNSPRQFQGAAFLKPDSFLSQSSILFFHISDAVFQSSGFWSWAQVNLYVGVGLLSLGNAFRLGGWISLVHTFSQA